MYKWFSYDGTTVITTHIGWVKNNGCGEIIFRQAAHPGNETDLPALGWRKVYV
jgi:hypothetical protein